MLGQPHISAFPPLIKVKLCDMIGCPYANRDYNYCSFYIDPVKHEHTRKIQVNCHRWWNINEFQMFMFRNKYAKEIGKC